MNQQNTPQPQCTSLRVTKLDGKAARARARSGVVKALEDAYANAAFEAIIKRPDGILVTVNGTWSARRHDYGEVFWTITPETQALDNDYPMWDTLIDGVSVHDTITEAFFARVPAKGTAAR